MRIALLFFALFYSFQSGNAQSYIADTDNIGYALNSSSKEVNPKSVKPPVVHAPEVFQEEEAIVFKWEAIDKPLRFDAQYEIKIFEKTATGEKGYLLFQNITRDNEYKLEYPRRFLTMGTDFSVIINSRLTGNNESYLIKGESTKKDFTYIPSCTTPKNVRISDITHNSVTIEWDGKEASATGVQYEILYGDSTQAKSSMESRIITSGLSEKITGLTTDNTYKFYIRKLCNAKGAEISKWVEIEQLMQRTISLPSFNCGEGFEFVDYESLEEACLGHPNYTVDVNEIFYIGGFPIYLDMLEWDNCETTETPITETNWTLLDTIYEPVYCYEPITEERTVDTTYQDCHYDYIYDYIWEHFWDSTCYVKGTMEGTGRIEVDCDITFEEINALCPSICDTIPFCSCNLDKEVWLDSFVIDEIIVDSFIVFCDDVTGPMTFLDTIGWDTIICDSVPEPLWGNETTVVGTETLSCGCTYSGEGIVPLPFLTEKVRVRFDDVPIKVEYLPNNEYKLHIYEGKAFGMWDAVPNRPSYDVEPAKFGEDICQVTPSQNDWDENGLHLTTRDTIDPNGFTKEGKYSQRPPHPGWQEGDPIDTTGTYDPWGYDANGIHRETGTTSNLDGCTREQLSSQPQPPPCNTPPDPYYWLQTDPTTQSGLNFAEAVKDTMDQMITRILTQMKTETADSLNYFATECQDIRDTMDLLVGELGYERLFVFGPNDDYFKKGMHSKFSKEPKTLGINLERVPAEEALEKKHVGLYHCDKNEVVFYRRDSIITQLLTRVPDLKIEILEKIKRLSVEDIKKFTDDIKNFEAWVTNYLDGETESIYEGVYSFNEDLNLNQQYRNYDAPYERNRYDETGFDPVNMIAGVDDNVLNDALYKAFENKGQEIEFQLKQGWKKINGIERAYYLEKMVAHRRTAAFTGMTAANPTLMPIVVANRGDDGNLYEVYLDEFVFTPYGATMNAHIILEIPSSGQKIAFAAYDIEIRPTGPKAVPVQLNLDSDISVRLSNALRLTIKGGDDTYVSFDCDGFAGIGLEAEVEICREYVKPYNPDTDTVSEDPEERVSGEFKVAMSSWGDFYTSISIDPFVVTGVEDVKWLVDGIVFDFSDTRSPDDPGMQPPTDYPHPFAQGNSFKPMWKGFYMKTLQAKLPNQFTDDGSLITPYANHVVIDDLGFSGHIGVGGLLPLERGDAGGWAFSVDNFNLTIINNHIKDATLNGKINVPLFKNSTACDDPPTSGGQVKEVEKEDCFDYEAFLEFGNKYHFVVDVGDNGFCIDMMKAGSLELNPESGLKMELGEDGFDVEANLSGTLSIGYDFGGGKEISAGDITFQNLIVRNKATGSEGYFEPGTWGFPQGAGISLGGFGLTMENIGLTKSATIPEESNLKFTTILDLVKDGVSSEKIDLTAAGTFDIVGALRQTPSGKQQWIYKEFNVNRIRLDGSFPGVKEIVGDLYFYEGNSTYGKGFRGMVKLQFSPFKTKNPDSDINLGLQAVAQFGSMTTPVPYKYFLVDLMSNFSPGIPIGPGFELYGFGGGIYYHMTRETGEFEGLPGTPTGSPTIPGLGTSLSGIKYTPNKDIGLGLKATVAIQTKPKKQAFNANATFEMNFNSGGGVNKVWFYGNGRFMSEPSPTYDPGPNRDPDVPVSCNVNIEMAFDEGFTLDGDLDVYINGPGGSITGEGHAEIYAGPDDWFINIGTPSSPVFLQASIAGEPFLRMTSYLDIGTNIPKMPGLPGNVRSLTGLGNIMGNESTRATGRGFAFGAAFEVGTGGKKYFPNQNSKVYFYGNVGGGAGFDIMLQDYGDAICAGSGQPIGINGWYASGQAWAYVRVGVGVGVKVWGKRKEFDVLDLSAAAALQMKLPNPFVAKGAIGGRYRLLGGLKKGNINFQFSIGQACQVSGGQDPASDLDMIMTTYPEDGAEGVSTDTKPSVTFNVPVKKNFPMRDENGDEVDYKVELNYLRVLENGSTIPARYIYNSDSTGITIKPTDMLRGFTNYEFEVKVTLKDGNNVVKEEHQIISFATEDRLDYIAPGNVIASYPLDGQYNFYKEEDVDQKGYVLLEVGQEYLFENLNADTGDTKSGQTSIGREDAKLIAAKFTPRIGGSKFYSVATYRPPTAQEKLRGANSDRVEFDMPASQLVDETYYKIEVVQTTTGQLNKWVSPGSNSGGNSAASAIPGNVPGVGVNPSNNPNENAPEETILFSSYFRTSKYHKFFDKIDEIEAVSNVTNNDWKVRAKVLQNKEPLDDYELSGGANFDPLVTAEFDENSGDVYDWYYNDFRPFYDYLSVDKVCDQPVDIDLGEDEEDDEEIKTVYFSQNTLSEPLNLTNSTYLKPWTQKLPETQYFNFNTIGKYYDEYDLIKTGIASAIVIKTNHCAYLDGDNELVDTGELVEQCLAQLTECKAQYEDLLDGSFPPLPQNINYEFDIRYTLPGTGRVTSSKSIKLQVP